MSTITRRNLVKGAALGAAAMGAVSSVGFALADEVQFDDEYDVVVLGMGGAGMNAAVAAYEEGAKVLLVEKAPEGFEPCNTKVCGQVILSTDDADAFYTYLTGLMGNYTNYDPECLRAYADGAAENFRWMVDILGGDPDVIYWSEEPDWTHMGGARWVQVNALPSEGIDRPGWMLVWDEFPELEGSEHALIWTFTGHEMDGGYYAKLRENIDAREGENLTVWMGAPGKRLITDADGAVVGVVIEKDGQEINVKANGGVCLCTGGFENNWTMLANHTQLPYAQARAGELNTGDGVLMAEAVGAQLWHMSNISGLGFTHAREGMYGSIGTTAAPNSIIVGPGGGRFYNEKGKSRHGRVSFGGGWNMTPMPMPAYYVVDSQLDKPICSIFSDGNVDEIESGEVFVGETLAELADNIRAAGKAPVFNLNGEFEAAVERFNAHVEAGEPDDFGRLADTKLEVGPFYAVELVPTMLNTQGGPRHNALAQILDGDAMPIEGLFSGGELGSIFPDMYNGGGNIGETMIFGRAAGRNAALRARGEFQGATEPAQLKREIDLAEKAAAAAEAPAAEEEAAPAAAGALADGVYEATGKGIGGDVPVTVTIEGGVIASVEVGENGETQGIGSKAIEQLPEAIVAANGIAGVDGVSGASVTSKAIFSAVEDALAQAAA